MKLSKKIVLLVLVVAIMISGINVIPEKVKAESASVNEQKVEIYCDINGIGNKEDIAYLVNIVDIYNENNKYLESIIEENKKDTWDYSRLDKIAITLIKLAIIEIEYLEIPFKISINECINICKKYNEEKNTKFINGILANYVKIKGLDNGI